MSRAGPQPGGDSLKVTKRQVASDPVTIGRSVTATAPGPWPMLMDNPIRDYDWGSTTTLARLQGRTPSGRPEAELWMGAHPSGPSRLIDDPARGDVIDVGDIDEVST